jgi:hypothetical protein
MASAGTEQILRAHLPEKATDYCIDLWLRYPFRLILKPSRVTKAGDYCARRDNQPVITMNRDLSPYLFLVTYVHEFSHHAVWMVYGNKRLPHGKEWKLAFKTFMEPVMKLEIFPPDLQARLAHHLLNPKASSFSDQKLTALFRKYDENNSAGILVSGLTDGAVFSIRGKAFKKGKLRRTRYECRELNTGRLYLVPADLPVDH